MAKCRSGLTRAALGLLKGGLLGGAVGYGAFRAGIAVASCCGWTLWVVYGAVGAVAGLLCGRPFWRHDTLWTPALKAVFGALVGAGLFALARRSFDPAIVLWGRALQLSSWPFLFGPVVGATYGALMELDDGAPSTHTPPPTGPSQ
jgi:hypothetical protein